MAGGFGIALIHPQAAPLIIRSTIQNVGVHVTNIDSRRVQVCDLNPWVYMVTTPCAGNGVVNNIKRKVRVTNPNPRISGQCLPIKGNGFGESVGWVKRGAPNETGDDEDGFASPIRQAQGELNPSYTTFCILKKYFWGKCIIMPLASQIVFTPSNGNRL